MRLACRVQANPVAALPEGFTLHFTLLPEGPGPVVLLLLHFLVVEGQPALFLRIERSGRGSRNIDLALHPDQLLIKTLDSGLKGGKSIALLPTATFKLKAAPTLALIRRRLGWNAAAGAGREQGDQQNRDRQGGTASHTVRRSRSHVDRTRALAGVTAPIWG